MNNKKVKSLRNAYKLTLIPKVNLLEVSTEGTTIIKESNFNKNEFRKIKKSTRKQPLEKIEKNKAKSNYKRVA